MFAVQRCVLLWHRYYIDENQHRKWCHNWSYYITRSYTDFFSTADWDEVYPELSLIRKTIHKSSILKLTEAAQVKISVGSGATIIVGQRSQSDTPTVSEVVRKLLSC